MNHEYAKRQNMHHTVRVLLADPSAAGASRSPSSRITNKIRTATVPVSGPARFMRLGVSY